MPSPAQLRARIAGQVSRGDTEAAEESRREYYAEVLAEKISAVVRKAPPLRPDQLERLRGLLAPSSTPEAA